MIYKYSKSKTADIPSQCYHPDLLPQSEFLALEQRVDEAENATDEVFNQLYLGNITNKEKDELVKKYEDIMDEIYLTLTPQRSIRFFCSLLMMFDTIATPAINNGNKIENKKEISNDGIRKAQNVESETSNTTSSPKSLSQPSQHFENSASDKIKNLASDDVGSKTIATTLEEIKEILEMQLYEIKLLTKSNTKNVGPISDEFSKKLELLDTLKIQFAEVKAQNETLKESVEQILQSSSVY
uniref:Uncharacterized protein n=1 Tax=Panagrolaimus sp. ES5 TaxID=591445 RepID=A0AC34G1Y3_9BILA